MFKSRSRECDPLLPQNEPSPEIQDYGSSRQNGSSEIVFSDTPTYQRTQDEFKQSAEQHYDESSRPEDNPTTQSSAWGTFITFITFATACALVLAALRAGDDGHKQPNLVPVPGHAGKNLTLDERVTKILTDTPLIDGHNDFAIWIRGNYKNDIHSSQFKDKFEHGGLGGNVDLPRLRKGMAGGAFWSTFTVCPENASTDFSDSEYGTAVAHTLQQIDLVKRLQRLYPSKFSLAGTSLADMLMRFHNTRTMLGPLSIEGLHQVPQSAAMSTMRLYYELGVRAATLTWNCHNAFADAALIRHNGTTKPAPYHRGGLTPAGRKLVREMNRLGMIVDVSHTSYWTQKSVMSGGTSKAPVVFTHSSAYTLCPHPRNVKDDILDLVKETNSIVMVNFSPSFISCEASDGDMPKFYPKNNTLHQAARHVVYIGDRIGYDHVGIGSDFDGVGDLLPKGLEGVDKFPDLIKELLQIGVSDANASKIVGGNILRVWRAVEEVARNMKREGVREGEDEVHGY